MVFEIIYSPRSIYEQYKRRTFSIGSKNVILYYQKRTYVIVTRLFILYYNERVIVFIVWRKKKKRIYFHYKLTITCDMY